MSLPSGAVCLDAQGAQNPHHHDRGIARYVVEHVRALHRMSPDAIDSVLLNPALPVAGNISWLLGNELLRWTTADRRVKLGLHRRPPIYHVMSPFEMTQDIDELWPAWARHPNVRLVTTLYDLIPLVFPEHYLRDSATRVSYQTRATMVRSADHILAISQVTAEDAIERLGIQPDRVTVVHAGATSKFADMYDSPATARGTLGRRLRAIRPGFMLYVGGFEFRKNLERLVRAYGLLPRDIQAEHQLVIACSMQASEMDLVRSWAIDSGIQEENLTITGYVSDEELGALYHACTLFVFASFYEGSGLPILEAMSCGAPVVASNTSTSPEILGDLDGTFDPHDPKDIASCLAETVSSPTMIQKLTERSRRRVAAYTWDAVAASSVAAYERAMEYRRRAGRRRPRLALVSPWPPEQSGIADYNLRLARELGKRVDVDVIVSNRLDHYATPLEKGVRLVYAGSFDSVRVLRQPDRILYCMGNSAFHRHVYELLLRYPGAVVAHDVRFTGFYGWVSAQECRENPQARLLEHIQSQYDCRLSGMIASGGWPSWQQQASMGIYMTREIQCHAELLFVHSRHSREVLDLDRGTLDRDVPVVVLPFGMPAPTQRLFRPPGSAPLIVSVGVVSEVKGLAVLISAAAQLRTRYKQLRLVIAGPGEPGELQRWRDLAREIAPAMRIELPGHLSEADYRRLLGEADLAVQLRTLSHGEASAAVADCLAAGVPTVVSDIGWASELPADVVARVPHDVSPATLASRLEELLGNDGSLEGMSHAAQSLARTCSFAKVAERYIAELELE